MDTINQFLNSPFDTDGKKASEFLSKKNRRRRRRRSPSPDSEGDAEEKPRKTKKDKRRKEKEQYKSKATIEDSDEEYGDLEAFLEKEKALREKTAKAAEGGRIGTMKATGTKKRRRKGADKAGRKKKRKAKDEGEDEGDVDEMEMDKVLQSDESDVEIVGSSKKSSATSDIHSVNKPQNPKAKSRPRPRPRFKSISSRGSSLSSGKASPKPEDSGVEMDDISDANGSSRRLAPRRKGRLVISDDDE